MSSEKTGAPRRPRQVTVWAWVGIAAALMVVVTAFDTVAAAGSLDTREMLQQMLGQPPWSEVGIDLAAAREMLRWAAMVSAAGAVAAAILLWQCLRRDRTARVGLSVAAVPVVIGGFATGGLSPMVVGAAALVMWLQPARDWFAGREPAARPMFRTEASRRYAGGPDGDRPSSPVPPPYGAAGRAPYPTGRTGPGERPLALVRACLLTIVFSGGALMLSVGGALAMASAPDQVMADLRTQDPALFDQGLSQDELVLAVYVVLAGFAVWCIAALVLAVLALQGQDWARITLVVSAAGAGMMAGVASLAQPAMLLVVAAAALAVFQLLRPEVNDWYRRR